MAGREGGSVFVGAKSRCELCGQDVTCLDEQDRCERCVLRADLLAGELLPAMEQFVRTGLERGLSEDQLREAFELGLNDTEGELAELSLSRRPGWGDEAGIWRITPYSAWLDQTPEHEPNRIRRLRRERGLSAEVLADQLGVAVAELALWEHTPEVPPHIVEQLAAVFAVSVPHLMKTDMDWLQG
ncbi:MAG TPA: helix-turn-helix domain-containing protein [Solirubrobacteraceae bacterium]|jgi:DNA-binding XRE family transcriptional regulator